MDENCLAFLEVRGHDEVRPHRAGDLDDRGGLFEAETLRDGQQLAFRHGDELGITAAGEQRADFLADLAVGITCVNDDASGLETDNLRLALGRRVRPARLEEVRAVDTGGLDLDEYFPGLELWRIHFAQFERAGVF